MKPKVLVVSTTFPRWENDNLPEFIYHFAHSLTDRCEVHVLAPHTEGAKKQEKFDGLNIFRFKYAPQKLELLGSGRSIVSMITNNPLTILLIPFFIMSAAISIVTLHIKHNFDVIHVHWMIPFGPVLGILRKFSDFKFIITSHGSDVFPFVGRKGLLSSFIIWTHTYFTLPNLDQLVVVSTPLKSAVKNLLADIPDNKISVISMGIDYKRFENKRTRQKLTEPVQLVFVGRLDEIKGVKYLIESLRILKEEVSDFALHIYGDGHLRNKLVGLVKIYKLSKRVTFHGFVNHAELPKKLAEADIFIGPSITTSKKESEGFGLVFLEAMAAGLAVIGTNVGGIPDIVINGHTGILVEEKNPEAIANAIKLVLEDNDLRTKIIQNGTSLAENYDWSKITENYFSVYET